MAYIYICELSIIMLSEEVQPQHCLNSNCNSAHFSLNVFQFFGHGRAHHQLQKSYTHTHARAAVVQCTVKTRCESAPPKKIGSTARPLSCIKKCPTSPQKGHILPFPRTFWRNWDHPQVGQTSAHPAHPKWACRLTRWAGYRRISCLPNCFLTVRKQHTGADQALEGCRTSWANRRFWAGPQGGASAENALGAAVAADCEQRVNNIKRLCV